MTSMSDVSSMNDISVVFHTVHFNIFNIWILFDLKE